MTHQTTNGTAMKPPPEAAFLERCPEAALLVTGDGEVLLANGKADGIVNLLEKGAAEEILLLVEKASDTGGILADQVVFETPIGQTSFELIVVPHGGEGTCLVLARDVTMERNLRPALMESRQRYKDLVEVSSDFAWEVGPQGEFVFVSPRGALGYTAEDLVGKRPEEFVIDAGAYRPLPFVSPQSVEDAELWMRRANGSLACVVVSCRPLYTEEEKWLGCRGVCRDITQEREREAALMRARHREQLLHYVVSAIRDEVEPRNMLTAAAAATRRALGAAGCRIYRMTAPGDFAVAAEYGDIVGLESLEEFFRETEDPSAISGRSSGPWQVLCAASHYRNTVNGGVCIWKATGLGDWTEDERFLIGDVAGQLGIAIEQIINHERIVSLSRTDSLTGLLNRRAFYDEEMPRRIRRLKRSGQMAALFYVDLDNFKEVNDNHGHHRGDEALLELRDLLIEHSRPGDLIARLGGDEFVMWLDGISPEVAKDRAEKLTAAGRRLHRFSEGDERMLGMSVGVAIYDPRQNESLDDLLSRADGAMYSVKRRSKGGFAMAEQSETTPPGGVGE